MAKLNIFNPIHQKTAPKSADAPKWDKYDLSAQFHAQTMQEWENLYQNHSSLARIYVQAQTLNYLSKHKKLPLTKAVLHDGNKLPDVNKVHPKTKSTPNKNPTAISVVAVDCLYAAQKFAKQGAKVAVLNMANQFGAGGGYLHGAAAQEEDLCRRSNLINSLDPKFYTESENEDYEQNGFGEYSTLYSDKVTVVRQGRDKQYTFLNADQQFSVSVISGAAYNLKFSNVKAGSKRYIQGMKNKIIMQLEAALQHGHKNLVLSAFGCGAFANDPNFVAKMYKEILAYPRYRNAFDNIVFAIVPNPGAKNDNYGPFKSVFSNQDKSYTISAQFQQERQQAPIQFLARILFSSIVTAALIAAWSLSLPSAIVLAMVSELSLVSLSYMLKPFNADLQKNNVNNVKTSREEGTSSTKLDEKTKHYLPSKNKTKKSVSAEIEEKPKLKTKYRKM